MAVLITPVPGPTLSSKIECVGCAATLIATGVKTAVLYAAAALIEREHASCGS